MAAEKPEQNGKQRPPPVKLSTLSVVYERGDAAPLLDDPLIHCQAGQQLVLAFVLRNALMDYFTFATSGSRSISGTLLLSGT